MIEYLLSELGSLGLVRQEDEQLFWANAVEKYLYGPNASEGYFAPESSGCYLGEYTMYTVLTVTITDV